jgi:ABC-type microcin C transport system permease subunit YejB
MAKRGLLVSPVLVIAGAIGWGAHGAFSVLLALAIVLVNFAASAAVVRKINDLPQSFIQMFVLGGFLVRMLFVLGAITLAGHLSWVSKVPLGVAIIVTHLGLLFWETRHISASLAYPGLKPRRGDA